MSSTNRIHGAGSPSGDSQTKTNTGSHRKVEKVEKIQEVAETDNERNPSKFRQMVDQEPEQESSLPSPFDLASSAKPIVSSTASDSSWDPVAGGSPENAPYSPPPSLSDSISITEESDDALPKSQTFWTSVDEPFDLPPPGPNLQETPRSTSRVFPDDTENSSAQPSSPSGVAKKGVSGGRISHKSPSPFELPEISGKTERGGSARSPLGKEEAALGKGIASPTPPAVKDFPSPSANPRYLGTAEEKSTPQSVRSIKMEGDATRTSPPIQRAASSPIKEKSATKDTQGKQAPKSSDTSKETPFREDEPSGETGSRKKQKKSDGDVPLQIESPSLTPLPDSVIPMAQAEAAAAAPYLSPEALAIYFHAVGTIFSMIHRSGDSTTEFVLDAPSFASSKFYGSTIAIQKFASAPDQITIKLTGSNEAVAEFNRKIPDLLALFQRKGRFAFAVNRIEAVYEKPLFRRKGSAGEKGFKQRGD